jgi:hypothetical protein
MVGAAGTITVDVLWSVRYDTMVIGATCVVASGVLVGIYNGAPPPDPMFDPEYGHDHTGVGNRGKRISHNDLIM